MELFNMYIKMKNIIICKCFLLLFRALRHAIFNSNYFDKCSSYAFRSTHDLQ